MLTRQSVVVWGLWRTQVSFWFFIHFLTIENVGVFEIYNYDTYDLAFSRNPWILGDNL